MSGNRRQLRKEERFIRDRTIHVYCTGCRRLFSKTHLLLKHRYAFSCGGNYLIEDEIHARTHTPLHDPDPMRLNTKRRSRRGRRPGEVRLSRMPGGSGFRNNWERMPFDGRQLLKWKEFS